MFPGVFVLTILSTYLLLVPMARYSPRSYLNLDSPSQCNVKLVNALKLMLYLSPYPLRGRIPARIRVAYHVIEMEFDSSPNHLMIFFLFCLSSLFLSYQLNSVCHLQERNYRD